MDKLGARTVRPPQGIRKLLPIALRRDSSGWSLRVYWGKLTIAVMTVAVLGWLAASVAVFSWARYRQNIADARWIDIVVPSRWNHFRHAQGVALLAKAQDALKAGNFGAGFHDLRVGLAKAPGDRDGRLLLSQIYASSRRPDLAESTLLAGVPYLSTDPDYLRALFGFLLSRQSDEKVIETSQHLLANAPQNPTVKSLAATAAATASYFRGNFDRAEDYLRQYGLERSRDGQLLSAKIDWERGYRELALVQIAQLHQHLPADEEIYVAYVGWLRELGRDDLARQISLARQIEFPDNPRPRVDLLYAYDRAGNDARVEQYAAAILRDFADNNDALLALADFAANTGRPALARQVFDLSRARGIPWEGPALMSMEALVVAGKFQAAIELSQSLLAENPELADRFYAVFNGLQAIAFYGLDDKESGQLFLNNFLNQQNVRAENLIAVSKRLIGIGARDQARQVLARASTADPLNQAALSQLIQLDLDAGRTDELPSNLRRLLAMRKPTETVLRQAYRQLSSDLLMFRPDRDDVLREVATYLGKSQSTSGPSSS